MASYTKPKALFFDVFGTVVSWRPTISSALQREWEKQLAQPVAPTEITKAAADPADPKTILTAHKAGQRRAALQKAKSLDTTFWETFAQDWRESYFAFTGSFAPTTTPNPSSSSSSEGGEATANGKELDWIGVDTFHYAALVTLLQKYGLTGLFPGAILRSLTLEWHRLPPHPDSVKGVQALLEQGIQCYSLGNGNSALLHDLGTFSKVPFTKWLGAEDFGAYKPSPRTYLGAAEKLGLKPEEVGMVAAHMGDCLNARTFGLLAFYVQRPLKEEAWSETECRDIISRKLVQEGVFVDEGGFEELARRLKGN